MARMWLWRPVTALALAAAVLTAVAYALLAMSPVQVTALDGTMHDIDWGRDSGGSDMVVTVVLPVVLIFGAVRAIRQRRGRSSR